jgi:hypothetical protein
VAAVQGWLCLLQALPVPPGRGCLMHGCTWVEAGRKRGLDLDLSRTTLRSTGRRTVKSTAGVWLGARSIPLKSNRCTNYQVHVVTTEYV